MNTDQIQKLANKLSEEKKRKELDNQAKDLGLIPKNYKDKDQISYAIAEILSKKLVNGKELPQYESNKVVGALKIETVQRQSNGTSIIKFEDEDYGTITETPLFTREKNPRAGGYYVIYSDGTKSFQNAEVFESGYNLVK